MSIRTLLLLAFLTPLTPAQAIANLIGGTPDTSNWPHPQAPAGNPYVRSTASPAAIAQRDMVAQLGKALFWEEQASSDNTMACGTCHEPRFGGTDGRLGATHANGNQGSFGVVPQSLSAAGAVDYGFAGSAQIDRSTTPVAAPTMIGAYLFNNQFWDLRAGPGFSQSDLPGAPDFLNFTADASLEDQAVAPPISSVEMGHAGLNWTQTFLHDKLGTSTPLAMVVPSSIPPDIAWIPALQVDYNAVFDQVFAAHPQFGGQLGVTRERFAMAIANYERTLIPDQAPIDLGTMTPSQINGFNHMKNNGGGGSGGCFVCHSATGNPTLTAQGTLVNAFDNLFSDGRLTLIGIRNAISVAQPPRKTATLRNLGLQKKFFSTGQVMTPQALIAAYHGSRSTQFGFPNSLVVFSPALTPTQSNEVIDFLFNALLDPRVANEQKPFDRPKLYSQSVTFGGNEFGTGTPPTGLTTVPEIIANAPPLVPKASAGSWVKLGVGGVEPGATTVIMFSLSQGSGSTIWVGTPTYYDYGTIANAQGIATYHPAMPLTSALIGVPLHFQWWVSGPNGYAYSDAATLVPFQF